ncbi:MazG-like protein [Paenibacillus physcomitrellae]|uniref:30S ribosomal protein S15 n=1 Tax=Paenibacillus physcomitrellae TaxID=1619311 RepID=A0ABQ1FYE3_9BACL|nr:MazG-like protein [Paenibacillus physcomitrellae]GGA33032.1 30S ribosomal protein S15 [Paenibacillus physcomitrellae]
MDITEAVKRSVQIRNLYHELEIRHHGNKWSIEEDALAFLTDAGLVGRLTMAQQERWPAGADPEPGLEQKLAECLWWLIVLADRMDLDFEAAVGKFLKDKERLLGE